MADNTTLNSGSGGDSIRTEDRSGVKTPVSLIDVGGASGSEAIIGDAGVAMPVRGLAAHDAAVSGNPLLLAAEAKDQDGSALPSAVSAEGDTVRLGASLSGVLYVMPVNEDGSAVSTVNAAQSGTWNITNVSGTVSLPTGASTLAEQQSQTTALQLLDDAIVADDAAFTPATTKVMMAGFEFDDTSPDSVNEGDAGAARMSARREVYVQLRDAAGNERGLNVDASGNIGVTDAGGALTVDGTITANAGTGTFTVSGTVTANAGTNLNTSLLALESGGNLATIAGAIKAEDAAHSSGHTGIMVLSVRQDSAAALGGTDADYQPLISDGSGRLHVNVGNTVTVGSHAVTNAGTFAVQESGAALTALQLLDDVVFSDDAAFTPGTSKLAVVGAQADETATGSVDEGDAGALRMTLDRKLYVTQGAHTAGGCSIFRSIDIDETEEDVKTTAGQVYGVHAMNLTNALLYLKFYNATAANVTVGTTTPVMTLPVPGNNDTDGAGFYFSVPCGIVFDTAICVACTTGVADNDTGAPAANACVVQVFYK